MHFGQEIDQDRPASKKEEVLKLIYIIVVNIYVLDL